MNCGATDFVWVNDIKTGSIGGGTLSLRARGELALGTRICRSCGHADLFLKDPAILQMPHTWKPGEFVPIPSRPSTPAPPHSSTSPSAARPPAPPSPPSTHTMPPPPAPTPPPPPVTVAPPPPAPPPPPSPTGPSAEAASGTVQEGGAPASKRPSRRRNPKTKADDSAPPATP